MINNKSDKPKINVNNGCLFIQNGSKVDTDTDYIKPKYGDGGYNSEELESVVSKIINEFTVIPRENTVETKSCEGYSQDFEINAYYRADFEDFEKSEVLGDVKLSELDSISINSVNVCPSAEHIQERLVENYNGDKDEIKSVIEIMKNMRGSVTFSDRPIKYLENMVDEDILKYIDNTIDGNPLRMLVNTDPDCWRFCPIVVWITQEADNPYYG